MDETTQTTDGGSSFDWNSFITNLANDVPAWITAARQPAGSASGTVTVTRNGVSGSVSPLIVVVIGAVLIAFILRK